MVNIDIMVVVVMVTKEMLLDITLILKRGSDAAPDADNVARIPVGKPSCNFGMYPKDTIGMLCPQFQNDLSTKNIRDTTFSHSLV